MGGGGGWGRRGLPNAVCLLYMKGSLKIKPFVLVKIDILNIAVLHAAQLFSSISLMTSLVIGDNRGNL